MNVHWMLTMPVPLPTSRQNIYADDTVHGALCSAPHSPFLKLPIYGYELPSAYVYTDLNEPRDRGRMSFCS
ncbi:hypothetical protein QCA50_011139 [Cerrena zonata]|uniref:Uncharacterized protein n=1 Tax=Cerrena zonata TaxID=2478898 RepID=A0AAW0FWA7_9APHY